MKRSPGRAMLSRVPSRASTLSGDGHLREDGDRRGARSVADPRGPQPGAAAGGVGRVLHQHPAGRGARARGRVVGARACGRARPADRRRAAAVGRAGERTQARAAHPRPLWQSPRRGRVPSGVAQTDGARRRVGTALAAVALLRAGGARGAGGAVHDGDAGRGGLRVPDHDDLRRDPGAARAARARGRVGATVDRGDLRPALDPRRREGLGDLGDGDDREAGRLGRARQHDGGARH